MGIEGANDMENKQSSYALANQLLKPPVRLLAVNAGAPPLGRGQYDESFDSIDAAYAFFRQKRPEGRWTLWLQGSDGQMIGVDSQAWESQ